MLASAHLVLQTVLLDLELYSGGLLLYCLKEGAPIVAALYPEHKQILVSAHLSYIIVIVGPAGWRPVH